MPLPGGLTPTYTALYTCQTIVKLHEKCKTDDNIVCKPVLKKSEVTRIITYYSFLSILLNNSCSGHLLLYLMFMDVYEEYMQLDLQYLYYMLELVLMNDVT